MIIPISTLFSCYRKPCTSIKRLLDNSLSRILNCRITLNSESLLYVFISLTTHFTYFTGWFLRHTFVKGRELHPWEIRWVTWLFLASYKEQKRSIIFKSKVNEVRLGFLKEAVWKRRLFMCGVNQQEMAKIFDWWTIMHFYF